MSIVKLHVTASNTFRILIDGLVKPDLVGFHYTYDAVSKMLDLEKIYGPYEDKSIYMLAKYLAASIIIGSLDPKNEYNTIFLLECYVDNMELQFLLANIIAKESSIIRDTFNDDIGPETLAGITSLEARNSVTQTTTKQLDFNIALPQFLEKGIAGGRRRGELSSFRAMDELGFITRTNHEQLEK